MLRLSGNETAQELHTRLEAALPFANRTAIADDTSTSTATYNSGGGGAAISRAVGCFRPSSSTSAFGVECRSAAGPAGPAGVRVMLLWVANFLKAGTTIEIRAQASRAITHVTDVDATQLAGDFSKFNHLFRFGIGAGHVF